MDTVENGYIESFNGKFRDECLNQNWFLGLQDARSIIENWRHDDNEARPHSALAGLAPEEFAAKLGSGRVQSQVVSKELVELEKMCNDDRMLRPLSS